MGKRINLAVLTIVCYFEYSKAAGLAVSVCRATVRPKKGSTLEAGAMLAQLLCKRQQRASNSDGRESRVVASAQRREDVNSRIRVPTNKLTFPAVKTAFRLDSTLEKDVGSRLLITLLD